MKRGLPAALSALLLSLALCVAACAAAGPETGTFADFRFAQREGFFTVITDRWGRDSRFDGVLSATSLEEHAAVKAMAAYAIWRGDERVLSVQLHDVAARRRNGEQGASSSAAANGFYAVELPVGDGYAAFLTGLSPEYLAELQNGALDAILSGDFLSLEDVSFIDAEKVGELYDENGDPTDSDAELCWAASTANLLYYTGWARAAGFGSADYVFERLIAEFSDFGGRCEFGLQWFFNGVCRANGWEDWASDEAGYDGFAGFLPDYCASAVARTYDLSASPENLEAVLRALRAGCGAELSYDHFRSWERTGGHSVTLWGMVYREGADLSQKDSWEALILSDSDNDRFSRQSPGDNRRTAPNTLNLRRIAPVCFGGYDSWTLTGEQKHWAGTFRDELLANATVLLPYGDAPERDGGARNAAEHPDPAVDAISLRVRDEDNATVYFAADSPVGVQAQVRNDGKQPCAEAISYRLRVTRQDGETVFDESGTLPALNAGEAAATELFALDALEPGVYEAAVTVSTGEDEAYHANNTLTRTFFVSARAREQDDLSFTATARYDGAMPFSARYGVAGTGCLSLRYSGDLGYDAAQYTVSVQYYDAEGEPLSWHTLYAVAERPETVYGLKPVGALAEVSVYAVPADPALGYERLLGPEQAELSYFYIELNAAAQEFSPISEADANLAEGEQLDAFFKKHSSGQEDAGFYFEVLAQGAASSRVLNGFRIETAEFGQSSDLGWSVWGFERYLKKTDSWEPVRLGAGVYSLFLSVYYSLGPDGAYRYYDYRYVGELTVLPAAPQVTDVSAAARSAREAVVSYRLTAPAHSAFTLELYSGTEADALALTESVPYDDFPGGTLSGSVTLATEPDAAYYYQFVLRREGADPIVCETQRFTAPGDEPGDAPPKPEPPDCEPLAPDGAEDAMRAGGDALLRDVYARGGRRLARDGRGRGRDAQPLGRGNRLERAGLLHAGRRDAGRARACGRAGAPARLRLRGGRLSRGL